jgi:hypothetical protein
MSGSGISRAALDQLLASLSLRKPSLKDPSLAPLQKLNTQRKAKANRRRH